MLKRVLNREFTHLVRSNIVIDEKPMCATLRATGLKTERAAVDLGLRTLLRVSRQVKIRRLRGKLQWLGDLDVLRTHA